MIIDDFYIIRVGRVPGKAHADLVVDPKAVLPLAVALQRFEAVTRNGREIFQAIGIVQGQQTLTGGALNRPIFFENSSRNSFAASLSRKARITSLMYNGKR